MRLPATTSDIELVELPPISSASRPVTDSDANSTEGISTVRNDGSILTPVSSRASTDLTGAISTTNPGSTASKTSWGELISKPLWNLFLKEDAGPLRAIEHPKYKGTGWTYYPYNRETRFLAAFSRALNEPKGGFSRLFSDACDWDRWEMMRWPEEDPKTGKRTGRYYFLVRKENEPIDVETAKASALIWSHKQGEEDLDRPINSDTRVCQITDGIKSINLVIFGSRHDSYTSRYPSLTTGFTYEMDLTKFFMCTRTTYNMMMED